MAVVTGKINDHALAHGAANQTGAGAARNDRHPRMVRRLNDRGGLRRVARKRDRQRFNLVMRRIRRIELAGQIVEGDLTIGAGQGRMLLRRRHARLCLQLSGTTAG